MSLRRVPSRLYGPRPLTPTTPNSAFSSAPSSPSPSYQEYDTELTRSRSMRFSTASYSSLIIEDCDLLPSEDTSYSCHDRPRAQIRPLPNTPYKKATHSYLHTANNSLRRLPVPPSSRRRPAPIVIPALDAEIPSLSPYSEDSPLDNIIDWDRINDFICKNTCFP